MPSGEILARLYEDAGYHEARTDGSPGQWTARAAQIVAALPRPPRTVLDFGAGEGHLVRALLDADLAAEGVEPSSAARRVALRCRDVELLPGLDHAAGDYEAVILLHVLEHVEDPVETLRALRNVLTADGHMFIEVPHAGSADMYHPKTRRAILDPPAHLHHFTPATLGTLTQRAGLSIVELRLFNARPVEAVLAWRHRRRTVGRDDASSTPATGSLRDPTPPITRPTSSAERLLAIIRAVLPGRKFQLVLRVADDWSSRG